MKFTMTKIAAAAVLAVAASGAQAQAVDLASWQLGDFNNDGLMSDFNFFMAPSGSSVNKFAPTGELCGTSDVLCAAIAMDGSTQGVNTFTDGFNFGGTGMFSPFTYGTGVQGSIDNGVLTFTSLDFGGTYQGLDFFLEPDNLAAVNVETLVDNGDGTWGVVVRYAGTINNPLSSFHGYTSMWRLEGTVAAVPEASTYGMMLAGLGLVGFAVRRRKLMA